MPGSDTKIPDDTIYAYVDGVLDGEARDDFEERIRLDARLKATVDEAFRLNGMLRATFPPRYDIESNRRILAAARRKTVSPKDRTGIRVAGPFLRWAAAIALVVTGFSGLGGYYLGQKSEDLQKMQTLANFLSILDQTTQQSLEYNVSGTPNEWSSGDSRIGLVVTPLRTFRNIDGTYCREYEETLSVEGAIMRRTGFACRKSPRSWESASF